MKIRKNFNGIHTCARNPLLVGFRKGSNVQLKCRDGEAVSIRPTASHTKQGTICYMGVSLKILAMCIRLKQAELHTADIPSRDGPNAKFGVGRIKERIEFECRGWKSRVGIHMYIRVGSSIHPRQACNVEMESVWFYGSTRDAFDTPTLHLNSTMWGCFEATEVIMKVPVALKNATPSKSSLESWKGRIQQYHRWLQVLKVRYLSLKLSHADSCKLSHEVLLYRWKTIELKAFQDYHT